MYGWRGRLGLILPSDNAVVEVDVARRLPEGVSSHVVRLSSGDQRDRMVQEAVEFAPYLVDADADVLSYMCAASSFLLGPEGNEKLRRDISDACGGRPAFTASTAMSDALRAVGARRVQVLSPHPPKIAEYLRAYLTDDGFEVAELTALDMGLRQINSQYPGDVYRFVRSLDLVDADALFIAATNFRAMDVASLIEADIGIPVITSNQVCLWAGLRALGVQDRLAGLGRLLEEH
jgi:maleate isomerase